jgi:hypothetical protein
VSTFAAVTGGTIAGVVGLVVCLGLCAAAFAWGLRGTIRSYDLVPSRALRCTGAVLVALVCVAAWWWGMAFTLSGDYHSWNVKEGTAEKVAKRLIATDNGMSERYVVTMDGQPYGIDDTRATLIEEGDRLSLRCKKDYQWGVPREAHGWACRWNGAAR